MPRKKNESKDEPIILEDEESKKPRTRVSTYGDPVCIIEKEYV